MSEVRIALAENLKAKSKIGFKPFDSIRLVGTCRVRAKNEPEHKLNCEIRGTVGLANLAYVCVFTETVKKD